MVLYIEPIGLNSLFSGIVFITDIKKGLKVVPLFGFEFHSNTWINDSLHNLYSFM